MRPAAMLARRLALYHCSRACSTWRAGDLTAYKILGVERDCTTEQIRARFHELAKATHPDTQSEASNSASTAHFVRVLAAYQILADPRKRALYDSQLLADAKYKQQWERPSRKKDVSRSEASPSDPTASTTEVEQEDFVCPDTEVVEWLKQYRSAITNAVHQKKIGVGRGFQEHFHGQMQSALRKAYHGPQVFEDQGIPDSFEADERAEPGVPDILHLVSGHNLFGSVRQYCQPLLQGLHIVHSQLDECGEVVRNSFRNSYSSSEFSKLHTGAHQSHGLSNIIERQSTEHHVNRSEFVDLELHVFGKIVARATRVQPKEDGSGARGASVQDCVSVYLTSERAGTGDSEAQWWTTDSRTGLLGTIYGLGETNPKRVCAVHGPDGKRTHKIVQHQTPMVKHISWYKETGPCECRCRRASMLPSRYWIFAPRSETHNVGGWYIETWKRRGQKNHNPRWHRGDPQNTSSISRDHEEQRLHPAMYIIAAAYKTLDEEAAQRRNPSFVFRLTEVRGVFSTLSMWCKRKLKLL